MISLAFFKLISFEFKIFMILKQFKLNDQFKKKMLNVSLFKIGLEIINIFKKIVIFIMRSKMKIVVIVMSIIAFF